VEWSAKWIDENPPPDAANELALEMTLGATSFYSSGSSRAASRFVGRAPALSETLILESLTPFPAESLVTLMFPKVFPSGMKMAPGVSSEGRFRW